MSPPVGLPLPANLSIPFGDLQKLRQLREESADAASAAAEEKAGNSNLKMPFDIATLKQSFHHHQEREECSSETEADNDKSADATADSDKVQAAPEAAAKSVVEAV